jgi:hypothetical protein
LFCDLNTSDGLSVAATGQQTAFEVHQPGANNIHVTKPEILNQQQVNSGTKPKTPLVEEVKSKLGFANKTSVLKDFDPVRDSTPDISKYIP